MSGAQILMGRPGKPAPEPMSISRVAWAGASGFVCDTLAGEGTLVHTGKEMAGGEEGFAEVAGYDFFLPADGGQVDAGVPAEE